MIKSIKLVQEADWLDTLYEFGVELELKDGFTPDHEQMRALGFNLFECSDTWSGWFTDNWGIRCDVWDEGRIRFAITNTGDPEDQLDGTQPAPLPDTWWVEPAKLIRGMIHV